MTGAQPDVAWSVQTGIDLDAMLAANANWIRRPVGTITEYRYYPRACELNTAQQIT